MAYLRPKPGIPIAGNTSAVTSVADATVKSLRRSFIGILWTSAISYGSILRYVRQSQDDEGRLVHVDEIRFLKILGIFSSYKLRTESNGAA